MKEKSFKEILIRIKSDFRNHKGFVRALMALFAVLLLVFAYSAMRIHPVTAADPANHRTWIFFVLMSVLTTGYILLLGVHFFVRPLIKKADLTAVIISTVAFFGIIYMFALPPMSAPDEIRHYLTAYKLSNQMMFKKAVTPDDHVYMRAEDDPLFLNDYPGYDDYNKFLNNWRGKPNTEVIVFERECAQPNLWVAYIPQALGITLARLLGLRQIPLMMLARLFNLAFYLICLYFSLRFLPFGKELLGLVSLFPMVLELTSSMSYDAFILGISFLYAAAVLKMAFTDTRVRVWEMVLVTAIMSVLGPIKIVYILLAFLMLIIPKEKFGGTKRYIICAASMIAVIGAVFLVLQLGKMTEIVDESNTYLNYAGTKSYTLSWILQHPADALKIYLYTFNVYGGYWFSQMIGSHLGWLEITIHNLIPFLFSMLMLFMLARPENEERTLKLNQRAACLCVAGLTAALTVLAMFIAYTPAGSQYIEGVQGRYFLPLLPVLLYALRGNSFKRGKNTTVAVIYAACILNFWTIASVISFICSRAGTLRLPTNT